jgi:HAD superfamily hydrolase (TIGR01509 family)
MLIIWDYFGVIANDGFWYAAEKIARSSGKLNSLKQAERSADSGELSWRAYCVEVARITGLDIGEVDRRYRQHNINQKVVQIIKALPNDTHVVLSNASGQYLQSVMHELHLHGLFTAVYTSSEIGYAKPDPRAFLHVLSRAGALANEAIFIDDSPQNVDAARSIGIKGSPYTEQLTTPL